MIKNRSCDTVKAGLDLFIVYRIVLASEEGNPKQIEGGQLIFLYSLGVHLKKRANICEKLLGLLNPHMPAMEEMLL